MERVIHHAQFIVYLCVREGSYFYFPEFLYAVNTEIKPDIFFAWSNVSTQAIEKKEEKKCLMYSSQIAPSLLN